ncbi:zinc ribbon domain-containing protein [Clostridioides sp. ZZV15-6388]|uniref:zinc ribbon domain-containing protein n=1 Tax=unclassified Clostridioides TaxID=2635829 RepID=UPI001D113056|nr:zinc ribbon domain-containing protein [Clostridioides sp. ZZV15-6388]MCC0665976.1 zinc ribbon domain-containing protein [Clostridioides sp. ZZV15-6597]
MEETRFCQCCGMPMGCTNELYGTNKDGSKSDDYCSYCFKEGEFTADISMEEMIEICIPPMVQSNKGMTEDEARSMMNNFFPTLKRWK